MNIFGSWVFKSRLRGDALRFRQKQFTVFPWVGCLLLMQGLPANVD